MNLKVGVEQEHGSTVQKAVKQIKITETNQGKAQAEQLNSEMTDTHKDTQ
jgi:hypothetical protein